MKITFTRQAFIDYHTPILELAFETMEGNYCERQDQIKEARGIIRAMLMEAYELDPQITNMKAQLFDAVTVIKNILQLARTDKQLRMALAGEPWELIMTFLTQINAIPVPPPFPCAQAAANSAHACMNQCYVCRFPAERNIQPKSVQDGEG